jgi:hypothetical protein
MMVKHMRSPALIVTALLTLLLGRDNARAREYVADDNFDAKSILSDEAAAAEVSRINGLQPTKSPVLNEASRESVQAAVSQYNGKIQQVSELINTDLDKIKLDTDNNVNGQLEVLAKALPACDEPQIVIARNSISGSYNYLGDLRRAIHDDIKPLNDPDNPDSHTPGGVALDEPTAQFCEGFRAPDKKRDLQDRITTLLGNAEVQVKKDQADAMPMKARLTNVIGALGRYKTRLENAIEDSASPAGKVAGQLWGIIAIFCTFAIAIFLVVKQFKSRIQFELIASGQVIQFATVMVILIVVCVLGISDILHENTLGTLLGAIGGYVLSQGVGRAASRKPGQGASGPPPPPPPTMPAHPPAASPPLAPMPAPPVVAVNVPAGATSPLPAPQPPATSFDQGGGRQSP